MLPVALAVLGVLLVGAAAFAFASHDNPCCSGDWSALGGMFNSSSARGSPRQSGSRPAHDASQKA